jgi:hypothetical protein
MTLAASAFLAHRPIRRPEGLVERWLCLGLFLGSIAPSATAQWLDYPSPGIPRSLDGKPNLAAPVPRAVDGKPVLDGIWFIDETPLGEFGERPLALRGTKPKPEDVILTPEGEALQRRRQENHFPGAVCLPMNIAGLAAAQPFKILSSRGVVAILYEVQTTYRQIFIDGRPLPRDPNPAWRGYSVGRWDGDTLVVDTTGFNDQESILPDRRPHSDALHIIERFRRRDFGHLEIQYTIEDPKVYAKPWTFKQNHHLTPDTELMEYICNENEKDLKHMVGVDR